VSAVRRSLAAAVATSTLALAGAGGVAGAEAPSATDAEEVARFVDGLVRTQMDEHAIPGAVAVVVMDGEVLVSRAYGHIDLDRETAVDVEQTRFDIGSVTKLFTATAVMQQVEEGRIDLDADVDRYLTAVEVPRTRPEPVTMRHLLTHTAGFADRHFVRMVAGDPEDVRPLGESLAGNLPPRIRPPGQVHQYSNHGMALAGHVVEGVAGRDFDQYLRERILEPLGMRSTTFGTPPGVAAQDAVGHESLVGPSAAVEPWYLALRPAGGLWSTGTDMARFMLAHLGGGEHGGNRILRAETVEEMHRTLFRPHPEVSGVAHGFFERAAEGRRVIQHGGGWIGFGSLLALVPEEGAGIFVAFNHGQGVPAGVVVVEGFLDRYFPVQAADGEARAAAGDASYAGTYRWNRVDRDTFMRLISTLQTASLRVEEGRDGALTTSMSPLPLVSDTRWFAAGDGVFRSQDGDNTLAFDVEDGRAVGLSVMGAQLFTMERVAWYESAALHLALLAVFVAVLLAAALAWPVGRLYGRVRGRARATSSELRLARRLSGAAGVVGLAFLLGFALFFAAAPVSLLQVSLGFRALLLLPLVLAVLTLALVVVAARLWSGRGAPLGARLYHSGLAVALLALLPFLYYWRLLGFHY
jgi:CubicO group peptidase (beta-lactamase class C family)